MENFFDVVWPLLVQLSEKGGVWGYMTYGFIAIGGVYALLTFLRAFLTAVVKITKTEKDDNIVAAIFAFLDKYAYGFGKLEEYYEDWLARKKKEADKDVE